MIIFGAGTDIYEYDNMSSFRITKKGIIQRDKMVIKFAKENNIPLAIVLSGGYHKDSADIIAESILSNLL